MAGNSASAAKVPIPRQAVASRRRPGRWCAGQRQAHQKPETNQELGHGGVEERLGADAEGVAGIAVIRLPLAQRAQRQRMPRPPPPPPESGAGAAPATVRARFRFQPPGLAKYLRAHAAGAWLSVALLLCRKAMAAIRSTLASSTGPLQAAGAIRARPRCRDRSMPAPEIPAAETTATP